LRELLILLVVVAVIAVIWYARRQSFKLPTHGEGYRQRPPAVKATPTNLAMEDASSTRPETGLPASAPGTSDKGAGLFQDASASAAGVPYFRAVDDIEGMTAELSQARRDAERAAERLANRASGASDAIQAAACMDGRAIPGYGSNSCPPHYPVKGDLTTMRYQSPDVPTYDQAVPDVCLESVAAAEAAGLAKSGREIQL
jgi:hypothetical protein